MVNPSQKKKKKSTNGKLNGHCHDHNNSSANNRGFTILGTR